MAYNTFRGMGVSCSRLEAYAAKVGWLRLQPKGTYELCRYRVTFQDRICTLVVYFSDKYPLGFARILLIGMPSEEQREANLDFFREIRGAVKWHRATDNEKEMMT